MTRSRSASAAAALVLRPAGRSRWGGWPLLRLALLLGLLSGSPVAWAQPAAGPANDSATATKTEAASGTSTTLGVLFGIVVGAAGAWLLMRRSAAAKRTERFQPVAEPEEPAKPKAQNRYKSPPSTTAAPVVASAVAQPPKPATAGAAAEGAGRNAAAKPAQGGPRLAPTKPAGSGKKNQPNPNSRHSSPGNPADSRPAALPRASAMNPTSPTPPAGDDQPLETGQTVEWATTAPTSTPPAIQELIEATAPPATAPPAAPAEAPAVEAAPSNGPLHFYAPAPDVPSIEHRKLSPNPLPQMPLLITLAHSEAGTAQFSFSPQADQSRIIGNGVRELKEFFAFELPPSEQFTTIKNLTPGKLEKRDDAWHVVQKAEIALS